MKKHLEPRDLRVTGGAVAPPVTPSLKSFGVPERRKVMKPKKVKK
jgi:hypothetical protein